ncbi:MAG: hypothetical protein R3Y24_01770 [Eubacteriales bacterium]
MIINMKKSFSRKLEQAIGKYAIENISLYLIICYAFGYLISFVNSSFINYLTLEPSMILKGQIWRLFTWILVPPSSSNVFFILITLYLYYSLGTSLERVWGTYRYNLYLFSGMLFTVIGGFLLYIGFYLIFGTPVSFGVLFSTYYINMSIFLAYAATFPDMQLLLMFIFPIKVKYLGIVYGAMLILQCFSGGIVMWVVVGASLLNFVVFFVTSRNKTHLNPKNMKRRQVYRAQVKQATNGPKHKCAICGRTEVTNPELEFRYCSKCEGNYEYCQEHLFTHEHVKRH